MAAVTGDSHTTYFPPEQNTAFYESLNGEFDGIGAVMERTKSGTIRIVSTITDSPAQKAGLKAGDVIAEVNREKITKDTSLTSITNKVKGTAGTEVELTLLRDGVQSYVRIVRAKIKVSQVEWKRLDNNDFYIRIVTFGNESASLFTQAVEQLKKESGIGKVIIDLRDNPGGDLSEVSKILAMFVPKGQSIARVQYASSYEDIFSAGYEGYSFTDKKIAILMNGGSASASEIMAGTIKDYLPTNTMLVGEKSYGKGTVQSLYPYPDSSSFKYTIAKWLTGKTYKCIDSIGLIPDKEIKAEENTL